MNIHCVSDSLSLFLMCPHAMLCQQRDLQALDCENIHVESCDMLRSSDYLSIDIFSTVGNICAKVWREFFHYMKLHYRIWGKTLTKMSK